MTRPLGHWLLLFALVAMWGSAFMFTGIAVRGFSPTALVTIRLRDSTPWFRVLRLAACRRDRASAKGCMRPTRW